MNTEATLWQPIETAPKTALKRIDLLDAGKRRVPDCYWSRHHQKWRSKHFDQYGQRLKIRRPTHWMFVPKPPKAETAAGIL
ncbi:DUF551 domain-containing protein [Tautonia marina]|uniref:DUF551 domain-containing protein n=1 Tax=Tautonia marina TaxID=2653855 RepID=UPI00126123C2|nr:DUF551 domain-containing protein [Tautonia marina]